MEVTLENNNIYTNRSIIIVACKVKEGKLKGWWGIYKRKYFA